MRIYKPKKKEPSKAFIKTVDLLIQDHKKRVNENKTKHIIRLTKEEFYRTLFKQDQQVQYSTISNLQTMPTDDFLQICYKINSMSLEEQKEESNKQDTSLEVNAFDRLKKTMNHKISVLSGPRQYTKHQLQKLFYKKIEQAKIAFENAEKERLVHLAEGNAKIQKVKEQKLEADNILVADDILSTIKGIIEKMVDIARQTSSNLLSQQQKITKSENQGNLDPKVQPKEQTNQNIKEQEENKETEKEKTNNSVKEENQKKKEKEEEKEQEKKGKQEDTEENEEQTKVEKSKRKVQQTKKEQEQQEKSTQKAKLFENQLHSNQSSQQEVKDTGKMQIQRHLAIFFDQFAELVEMYIKEWTEDKLTLKQFDQTTHYFIALVDELMLRSNKFLFLSNQYNNIIPKGPKFPIIRQYFSELKSLKFQNKFALFKFISIVENIQKKMLNVLILIDFISIYYYP